MEGSIYIQERGRSYKLIKGLSIRGSGQTQKVPSSRKCVHPTEALRLTSAHSEASICLVQIDAMMNVHTYIYSYEYDDEGRLIRESEILAAMGSGLTTRDIAEKFGLSGRTVEVHRGNIKRKLGCHSLAEMMVKAAEFRRAQDAALQPPAL